MGIERHGGLRAQLATLAAELMVNEQVKQYFTAKRIAAKRLLGRGAAKSLRDRPRDLPSNGEIKAALLELVERTEGEARFRRLFAMRIAALEAMDALAPFTPRLIGSVATGHVRSGSDIDLHVFAPDPLEVVAHVARLGWPHETQQVSIVKGGKPMDFTHVHPRSSTDGKPIVRLSPAAVRAVCEREHPDEWTRYLTEGEVPSWEEVLEADEDDDDVVAVTGGGNRQR